MAKSVRRICKGVSKVDNRPCRNTCLTNSPWCQFHDPARAKLRKKYAIEGYKTRLASRQLNGAVVQHSDQPGQVLPKRRGRGRPRVHPAMNGHDEVDRLASVMVLGLRQLLRTEIRSLVKEAFKIEP